MKEYNVRVFNNRTEWFYNGECHREDGPAIEWTSGIKEWWLNGECHREDGPAIESANGGKQWYKNGKLHRDDGPARIWADGKKEWWINGDKYSESEFLTKAQPVKELTVADIEKLLGHKVKVVK